MAVSKSRLTSPRDGMEDANGRLLIVEVSIYGISSSICQDTRCFFLLFEGSDLLCLSDVVMFLAPRQPGTHG